MSIRYCKCFPLCLCHLFCILCCLHFFCWLTVIKLHVIKKHVWYCPLTNLKHLLSVMCSIMASESAFQTILDGFQSMGVVTMPRVALLFINLYLLVANSKPLLISKTGKQNPIKKWTSPLPKRKWKEGAAFKTLSETKEKDDLHLSKKFK